MGWLCPRAHLFYCQRSPSPAQLGRVGFGGTLGREFMTKTKRLGLSAMWTWAAEERGRGKGPGAALGRAEPPARAAMTAGRAPKGHPWHRSTPLVTPP